MGRAENVSVFNDTEKMVKENKVLSEAVKNSTAHQVLIPEYMSVSDVMPKFENAGSNENEAEIIVSKKRTYEAEPNLRLMPSNAMNSGDGNKRTKISDEDLYALHVKRLSRIMEVAIAGGNEVIILGAFGCGAFENNPKVVAKASKAVVEKYSKFFKTIEFAVYCSPKDERNYGGTKRWNQCICQSSKRRQGNRSRNCSRRTDIL